MDSGVDGGGEIEAVLFDLDGTLLDRRETFRRFLEGQLAGFARLRAGPALESHLTELLRLDNNGMTDRDEFYREVEARLDLGPGGGAALRADFEARFPEECVPLAGMVETLEGLRRRGLRLGLITNGRVLVQSRKIRGLGLEEWLDSIVISEATGLRKPDSRIFALALGELEVAPGAAAYVGDNPEADVAGARAGGLRAVWRRDAFFAEPSDVDLIIGELPELLPWVDAGGRRPWPGEPERLRVPAGEIRPAGG